MGHMFTADLHFGHDKVAAIRGFSTTAEHDAFLLKRLNDSLRPDTVLWVLGDLGLKVDADVMAKVGQIRARKVLIAGNHDPFHPMHRNAWKHQRQALEVFEAVMPYQKLRLSGRDVLLNHLPYRGEHLGADRYTQYRMPDEGFPMLCGHVHEAWRTSARQFNVGVDVNDFRPVDEQIVLAWMTETRDA